MSTVAAKKRLFVVMDDETQQVCPVEAENPDEARLLIAEQLGKDVGDQPLYDADKPDELDEIISILQNALSKE